MHEIDCTDCYLEIQLGGGVKRALVHHFTRFLTELLKDCDIEMTAPVIDKVDQEAWRLAAKILSEVTPELSGALDETLLTSDPQRTVQEILTQAVTAAVGASEHAYLRDDFLGLDSLIARLNRRDIYAPRNPD